MSLVCSFFGPSCICKLATLCNFDFFVGLPTRDGNRTELEPISFSKTNRTNPNCQTGRTEPNSNTMLSERRARMCQKTLEKLMFLMYVTYTCDVLSINCESAYDVPVLQSISRVIYERKCNNNQIKLNPNLTTDWIEPK